MCRKFHGAAFLKTYLAPNGTKRQFCDNCGSSLTFVPSNDTGELVEFSLGTLESKIELRPDAHIFTNYRASWYELSDDLPQFTGDRDSKQKS